LIFEDYDKGVLTSNLIKQVIEHCRHVGVTTSADPKHLHFFDFKHVHLFKPNLHEVEKALGKRIEKINEKQLELMYKAIKQHINPDVFLLTLSEKGIYVRSENCKEWVTAIERTIADVSGAGDTVIATASVIYTLTKNEHIASKWSNIAGGIVCEKPGVVTVDKLEWKRQILKYEEI
jgi:ADP-heptose synthase, bifunctional sugar kinase/adenylyltransferase